MRAQQTERDRQQVVKALLDFYRAAIRKALIRKSHRRPSNGQVNAVLPALRNEIAESLHLELRAMERAFNKPYREWSPKEHGRATKEIVSIFEEARAGLQRRGRPPKRKPTRGIIASAMQGAPWHPSTSKRNRLPTGLSEHYQSFVFGSKMATLIKDYLITGLPKNPTKKQVMETAIPALGKKGVSEADIYKSSLGKGEIRRAFQTLNIDPRHAAALKKRLQRAKRPR